MPLAERLEQLFVRADAELVSGVENGTMPCSWYENALQERRAASCMALRASALPTFSDTDSITTRVLLSASRARVSRARSSGVAPNR